MKRLNEFGDSYQKAKNRSARMILFLLGILLIGMSGIAIIFSVIKFVVGPGDYPMMAEASAIMGIFSFVLGVLACLPFYAFDTEGDLIEKILNLRIFHPSTKSTNDPISEKIRASEEKKYQTKANGKFMWEK